MSQKETEMLTGEQVKAAPETQPEPGMDASIESEVHEWRLAGHHAGLLEAVELPSRRWLASAHRCA
jgi:hypothetical protein